MQKNIYAIFGVIAVIVVVVAAGLYSSNPDLFKGSVVDVTVDEGGETQVDVKEGEVDVRTSEGSETVKEGKTTTVGESEVSAVVISFSSSLIDYDENNKKAIWWNPNPGNVKTDIDSALAEMGVASETVQEAVQEVSSTTYIITFTSSSDTLIFYDEDENLIAAEQALLGLFPELNVQSVQEAVQEVSSTTYIITFASSSDTLIFYDEDENLIAAEQALLGLFPELNVQSVQEVVREASASSVVISWTSGNGLVLDDPNPTAAAAALAPVLPGVTFTFSSANESMEEEKSGVTATMGWINFQDELTTAAIGKLPSDLQTKLNSLPKNQQQSALVELEKAAVDTNVKMTYAAVKFDAFGNCTVTLTSSEAEAVKLGATFTYSKGASLKPLADLVHAVDQEAVTSGITLGSSHSLQYTFSKTATEIESLPKGTEESLRTYIEKSQEKF